MSRWRPILARRDPKTASRAAHAVSAPAGRNMLKASVLRQVMRA